MFNKISFFCISPWLFSQIIYAKEYLWINAQKRLINLVLLRNVLINFQSYLILSLFKVYEAFMEFNFFSISVKVSTYNSQNNQCPLALLL